MPQIAECCSRNAAEFGRKCMSDSIRNKAIFEIKIAKLFKTYQKLTFCQFDSNVAQWECFAHSTKNSGVSIFNSYRDLAWKNKNSKFGFWPKLIFLAKLNFNLLLHNFSRHVIYGHCFNFLQERFWEIWLGQG